MEHRIKVEDRRVGSELQTMATTLTSILGRMPTAYVVGVTSTKTVTRWSKGIVESVREPEVRSRLENAYSVVTYLQRFEADDTIRSFMFGMNPTLSDESPLGRLADGDFEEVMDAARALVSDSY